jgi:hypothetical protein
MHSSPRVPHPSFLRVRVVTWSTSQCADAGRSVLRPYTHSGGFFISADSARLEIVCFHTHLQVQIPKCLRRTRDVRLRSMNLEKISEGEING